MKKEDLKKIIFEEAVYVKNLIEEKKKIEKKLKKFEDDTSCDESEIEETTGKGQGVNRRASHKGEIGKKLKKEEEIDEMTGVSQTASRQAGKNTTNPVYKKRKEKGYVKEEKIVRDFIKNLLYESYGLKKKLNEDSEISKENSPTKLTKINQEEAEQLFHNGIYIYIKTSPGEPDSTVNIFSLNNKTFDGSMNIYTAGVTPEEYGFENILNWIKEREDYPIEFYTFYSKIPWIVDYENNKISPKRTSINEKFEVSEYIVTVKHDEGNRKIRTSASSEDAAKKNVMSAEGCPENAIISIKKA